MGKGNEQSLRAVSPKLYNVLITELEKYHIHPYDIQANVIKEKLGLNVIIRYGEGFQKTSSHLFSPEVINAGGQEITDFINDTAETCKEMLIADYFKMIKL